MALVTIFALVGDDLRLWLTTKVADLYFNTAFAISLFLFALELFLNSMIIHEFKYSFFFWLDMIATLSLIPDISWIMWLLAVSVGTTPSEESKDIILG
jgi:hypothetical protein